jgi:hypothetical protein
MRVTNGVGRAGILRSALGIMVVSGLAACGSSGGSEAAQVATLTTDGAAAVVTETTVAADTADALLAYAQCMRDNGIEMEDPTFDADGNVEGGFRPGGDGVDFGSEAFQTAQTACGSLIEGVDLGGRGGAGFDRTAMQDAFNSFTACLRDEGLEVDDITMGDGPGAGGPGGPPSSDQVASGDSVPDGGFDGGPPGSAPDGATRPDGEGFDPTSRMIEQLGLDDTDPAVTAALEVCQPVLEAAFTASDSASSTDTTDAAG